MNAGIPGLNKWMGFSLAKRTEESSHPLKTSVSPNPLVLEQYHFQKVWFGLHTGN